MARHVDLAHLTSFDMIHCLRACTYTPNTWTKTGSIQFFCRIFLLFLPLSALAVPMMPNVSQFETTFVNLDNLTIIDHGDSSFQRVTRIGWGILTACYQSHPNNDRSHCVRSGITSPYSFTVSENNNQIHATVQKTWINTMFIHICCYTLGVFTWIVILISVQIDRRNHAWLTDRRCCVGLAFIQGLVVALMASMVVTVLADWYIFSSIMNEMQSLGRGGSTTVDTKLTFYVWTVGSCIVIFLICCLLTINLATDIYEFDHYLTKVDDFREKAGVIQKRIKALKATKDEKMRWDFVHYAVVNIWP